MSLALLQTYPSDQEDDSYEEDEHAGSSSEEDELSDRQIEVESTKEDDAPSSSLLPSPAQAFAEITGPPDFLLHSVTVVEKGNAADKKSPPPPPAGAVVEAKPQAFMAALPVQNSKARDPSVQEAANLLGMCVQCGVPKIVSAGKMTCPQCKDRPREQEKRASSKVKDKEKSKRMKGQSSHSTWKSESEMALRQQFD